MIRGHTGVKEHREKEVADLETSPTKRSLERVPKWGDMYGVKQKT